MAARMVDLNRGGINGDLQEEGSAIDEEVLLAFERGARVHVEKSLDAVKKDLDARAEQLLGLIPDLQDAASLNEAVLRAAAQVVSDTRYMLMVASRLQAALVDKVSAADAADAKRTFYHKNYSRARGIVSQVQEVADAISFLCDACNQAAEGADDVEKVRSNVGNLRAAMARLLTASDVKFQK